MTLDQDLKNEITKYYFNEYYQSAFASEKGFIPSLMRWREKLTLRGGQNPLPLLDTSVAMAGMIPWILIGAAVGALSNGLFVIPALITAMGAFFAFDYFVGTKGRKSLRTIANQNMEADIENLADRYNKEILQVQLQNNLNKNEELTSKIQKLSSAFATSSTGMQPDSTASTGTAPEVRP